MAETLDAPQTTQAAPPSSEGGGIGSFMADVMVGVEEEPKSSPKAAPEPPKTPEKPAKAATPEKPPEKPADPKTDPKAATAPKPDMNSLRRRHDELVANEKKFKSDIAKLREENQSLSSRKFITPEVEKEIDENKKEIERLKGQLSESAYENSDEFKAKYTAPWQRTVQAALAMVDQMQTPGDEDAGVAPRKTTSADFQRVLTAPVGEQAEVAQKLFGVNALRILTVVEKLNDLRLQADDDIKQHRQTAESRTRQFETWRSEQAKQYQDLRDSSRRELAEKYPTFFAPDESDPEASEALQKGYEFVDQAATHSKDMPPDKHAAYWEVMRARAAWFSRGYLEINRLKEKVKSLEDELGQHRKSDPGSAKEKLAADGKPDDEFGTGIEGMAAAIEKAAKS